MKTAQGSITVDVSKFNSAIDSAKGKLSSFGSSLGTIGNSAKLAWKAFDAVANVSEKISTIAQGGRDLQAIFSSIPALMGRVSTAFANLKALASQVGGVLARIPLAFKAIGISAVVAGVSIYGVAKALQGVAGITKSALSGISSVASGLANMAKSATTAVGGAVSSAFRGFLNILKPVGVAVGGLGLAFGALDRFFKIGITSAIELGDEMKNLAGRTGASIPFLFDLQKLLKNSGISSMSGATALLNMQRALTGVNADGEPTNDMLARLNLNVDELMKMTPEQQFLRIGSAISKLSTSAEQTAASFSIFGRAGASLKGIFKEAGFAELGTKQSQLGQSLAKNADNFSKISAKLRDSGEFFRGFFVEMAGAVAPSILELFKLFEGGDMLAGFGAKLGEQIKFGVEVLIGAFKTGTILDLLKVSFETASIVLKDLLQRTFTFGSSLLARLLEADVSTAMISGIGSALIGALSIISGTLLKAIATPLAFFSAGIQTALETAIEIFAKKFPKLAKLMGIDQFSSGGFEANFADQKKLISGFADETVKSGFGNIGKGIKDSVNAVKESFLILQKTLTDFPPQSEEAKKALADFSDKINATAVAGRSGAKAQGEVAGAEVLGAKVKSMSGGRASEGISSLQRIGGGGGAFGGWTPQKTAEEQLAETQRTNELLYQQGEILKNPRTGEYVIRQPTMPAILN
jgi:hypothetical protein